MSTYVPRFTVPDTGDINYKNINYGGKNRCIVRNTATGSVLPNCTATEMYATANIREWRHFFEMRCDKTAQEDIRSLALSLLCQMYEQYPVFFEDMVDKYAIMD